LSASNKIYNTNTTVHVNEEESISLVLAGPANSLIIEEKSGVTSNDVEEIRVALTDDSTIELVNGGVCRPAGVEHEIFVIQANKKKQARAN